MPSARPSSSVVLLKRGRRARAATVRWRHRRGRRWRRRRHRPKRTPLSSRPARGDSSPLAPVRLRRSRDRDSGLRRLRRRSGGRDDRAAGQEPAPRRRTVFGRSRCRRVAPEPALTVGATATTPSDESGESRYLRRAHAHRRSRRAEHRGRRCLEAPERLLRRHCGADGARRLAVKALPKAGRRGRFTALDERAARPGVIAPPETMAA